MGKSEGIIGDSYSMIRESFVRSGGKHVTAGEIARATGRTAAAVGRALSCAIANFDNRFVQVETCVSRQNGNYPGSAPDRVRKCNAWGLSTEELCRIVREGRLHLRRIETGNGAPDLWADVDGCAYWDNGSRVRTSDVEADESGVLRDILARHNLTTLGHVEPKA